MLTRNFQLQKCIADFIAEECVFDKDEDVHAADLYYIFTQRAKGKFAFWETRFPKQKGFTEMVKRLYPGLEVTKTNRSALFKGIRLRSTATGEKVVPKSIEEEIPTPVYEPPVAPVNVPFPPWYGIKEPPEGKDRAHKQAENVFKLISQWKTDFVRLYQEWKNSRDLWRLYVDRKYAADLPKGTELRVQKVKAREADAETYMERLVRICEHEHTIRDIEKCLPTEWAKDKIYIEKLKSPEFATFAAIKRYRVGISDDIPNIGLVLHTFLGIYLKENNRASIIIDATTEQIEFLQLIIKEFLYVQEDITPKPV